MTAKRARLLGVYLALGLCLGMAAFLPAARAEDGRSAVITELSGHAIYLSSGASDWQEAAIGTVLHESDIIKTAEDTHCTLLFTGMSEATVRMRPNSVLELTAVSGAEDADDTELELTVGSILVKAEKLKGASQFEVKTPNSVVGIRGTEFEVMVD